MSVFQPVRPRHRLFLAYAVAVCVAAALVLFLWPGQRWGVVIMLGVGLAAAWFATQIGSRHLRRRLHRLRETADAMARGDLTQQIERPPHDDFVKLADSLERMLAQLQETMREQDRLRQQLTRSEKLALIGELAATVAHEVNNPLDGLQNSTRIIRRNLANTEQTRQLLDMMDAGLYRIEMIVRRLLTMSRDEPVNLTPARIDEIVSDAVVFVQPRLERCAIELVRDFPDVPLLAQADRVQFAQVLINLMLNAADSMQNGGKLTVRCRTGDRGQKVLLEVIDTGNGIAQEHLPHIFEPFYTTRGKGAGTGLGLSVVARIVEAHQGKVQVSSEVGKGTRFRIELPAAAQGPKPDRAPAAALFSAAGKPITPADPRARAGEPA